MKKVTNLSRGCSFFREEENIWVHLTKKCLVNFCVCLDFIEVAPSFMLECLSMIYTVCHISVPLTIQKWSLHQQENVRN